MCKRIYPNTVRKVLRSLDPSEHYALTLRISSPACHDPFSHCDANSFDLGAAGDNVGYKNVLLLAQFIRRRDKRDIALEVRSTRAAALAVTLNLRHRKRTGKDQGHLTCSPWYMPVLVSCCLAAWSQRRYAPGRCSRRRTCLMQTLRRRCVGSWVGGWPLRWSYHSEVHIAALPGPRTS